jgi:hypothetical protein
MHNCLKRWLPLKRRLQINFYKFSFSFRFFDEATESGLYFQDKRNEPPLVWRAPEDLIKLIDFSLTETGIGQDEALNKTLNDIILYTAHQAHPYFIFQVYAAGINTLKCLVYKIFNYA